jgi:hypothetical protein
LGIDPDFFLFTGNSSYDYNGTYQVQVIGADIDPAKSTTLEGVTTSQVLLTIDQGGSTVANNFSSAVTPGAAPEPGSLALCAAGCLLTLLYFGVKDHAWRSSANR